MSPEVKEYTAAFLRSRYSCERETDASSSLDRPNSGLGGASPSAAALMAIVRNINLPPSFESRFMAVVYLCHLQEAPDKMKDLPELKTEVRPKETLTTSTMAYHCSNTIDAILGL